MTAPEMVGSNDPDLARFRARDPEWFLRAASAEVRRYCRWHIAPVVATSERVEIVGGVGFLHTLKVVSVQAVTVGGLVLTADEYDCGEDGVLEVAATHRATWATVAYTHGHAESPEPVKSVVFELASTAQMLPAGVADRVGSGPFSISLKALGLTLSDEQRERLSTYRLNTAVL